jgi:hypothetical protein
MNRPFRALALGGGRLPRLAQSTASAWADGTRPSAWKARDRVGVSTWEAWDGFFVDPFPRVAREYSLHPWLHHVAPAGANTEVVRRG